MNRLRNSPHTQRIAITSLAIWFLYVTSSLCYANCNFKPSGSDTSQINNSMEFGPPYEPHNSDVVAIKSQNNPQLLVQEPNKEHCKITNQSKYKKADYQDSQDGYLAECCSDDCDNQEHIAVDGKGSAVYSFAITTSFAVFDSFTEYNSVILKDYFHQIRQKIPIPDIFLIVCSFLN